MMKKFAVILSGNGVFDGAEIHESVLTLLAIKRNGADYEIFAPDIPQYHVINHITGDEMDENRNVLIESARIARGNIKSLKEFSADQYDAIILPGGFGAAKNLSTFAFDGVDCKVDPNVEKALKDMLSADKPIGALCISPVILAKVIGNGVELTIGQDTGTIEAIEKLGAAHKKTMHGEVVVDKNYKIATTPCYMLDAGIEQIADGANNIVKALLDLISN